MKPSLPTFIQLSGEYLTPEDIASHPKDLPIHTTEGYPSVRMQDVGISDNEETTSRSMTMPMTMLVEIISVE